VIPTESGIIFCDLEAYYWGVDPRLKTTDVEGMKLLGLFERVYLK